MRMNIILPAALAAGLLGAPLLAAQEQSAPPHAGAQGTMQVKAGDPVFDPSGNPVGTIAAIEGNTAVLATGAVNIRIPVNALRHGDKGHMIAMTKSEIEAAAQGNVQK